MFRWYREGDEWKVDKPIQVEPVEVPGWSFPAPGLIIDLIVSLDERFLHFSNRLHSDLRQCDFSDPANPQLAGRFWLGEVGQLPVRQRAPVTEIFP